MEILKRVSGGFVKFMKVIGKFVRHSGNNWNDRCASLKRMVAVHFDKHFNAFGPDIRTYSVSFTESSLSIEAASNPCIGMCAHSPFKNVSAPSEENTKLGPKNSGNLEASHSKLVDIKETPIGWATNDSGFWKNSNLPTTVPARDILGGFSMSPSVEKFTHAVVESTGLRCIVFLNISRFKFASATCTFAFAIWLLAFSICKASSEFVTMSSATRISFVCSEVSVIWSSCVKWPFSLSNCCISESEISSKWLPNPKIPPSAITSPATPKITRVSKNLLSRLRLLDGGFNPFGALWSKMYSPINPPTKIIPNARSDNSEPSSNAMVSGLDKGRIPVNPFILIGSFGFLIHGVGLTLLIRLKSNKSSNKSNK